MNKLFIINTNSLALSSHLSKPENKRSPAFNWFCAWVQHARTSSWSSVKEDKTVFSTKTQYIHMPAFWRSVSHIYQKRCGYYVVMSWYIHVYVPFVSHQSSNQVLTAFYVIFFWIAPSSARIFLKVGLFLGSYCQQLFIILAISTGQERGAGIRYPGTTVSRNSQSDKRILAHLHAGWNEESWSPSAPWLRPPIHSFLTCFFFFLPFSTSSRVCWLLMLM